MHLKTLLSVDGKRRVMIYHDEGGLFSFDEDQYLLEDTPYVAEVPSWYWSTVYSSGKYGSAADAERDARASIPWLRDNPSISAGSPSDCCHQCGSSGLSRLGGAWRR